MNKVYLQWDAVALEKHEANLNSAKLNRSGVGGIVGMHERCKPQDVDSRRNWTQDKVAFEDTG